MPNRQSGLWDQISVIYVVATVCLMAGSLTIAFIEGIRHMGAPLWAWYCWIICMLLTVNIAYFLGGRKLIKPMLIMGCIPLMSFSLLGTIDPAANIDSTADLVDKMVSNLSAVMWKIVLVVLPVLQVAMALANWLENKKNNLQSNASQRAR